MGAVPASTARHSPHLGVAEAVSAPPPTLAWLWLRLRPTSLVGLAARRSRAGGRRAAGKMRQSRETADMNRLEQFANVLDAIRHGAAVSPGVPGRLPRRVHGWPFRTMFGVDPTRCEARGCDLRPTIADGEGWFEAVNWGWRRARRASAS